MNGVMSKMETRKISIEELASAAYNPRVDLAAGDPDYEKLKRSIEKFGHVQPIVWNKRTGNIVGGNQSLKVLKDLGYTEADCVIVDLGMPEEKALNVALNKISGRWDIGRLSEIMGELIEEGLSELTGYSEDEIARLTSQAEQYIRSDGELDPGNFADEAFKNKCPRCGFLF